MRRTVGISLQVKIGAFVVAGLFVIFAIFGLLGWLMLRQNIQRMVDERLVVAQLTASFLDIELEEQFEQLEWAAPLVAAMIDNRAEQGALRDLQRHEEPFVAAVFFIDPAGRLHWLSGSRDLTVQDGAFLTSLGAGSLFGNGQRYVSAVRLMGSPPQPLAVVAVSSTGPDGLHAGALSALVDMGHAPIRELIAGARQLGDSGHAELIDQNGVVVASSEPNRTLKPAEHPDFYRPLLARRASAAGITRPSGDEDPAEQGQRHAMAFAPLRVVPWGLSLGGSEAELFLEADRWRSQIIVLGGLALAAALCLVWITVRSVAASVRALTMASKRIGAGDLATPVPDLGDGEVRTLAESLEDMRCHLRDALDALAVETSRYQGIVGSMADAVFTTDPQCRVTSFNPAAEGLIGWRSAVALGRLCHEVLRPQNGSSRGDSSAVCPRGTGPCKGIFRNVTKEVIQGNDGRSVSVAHVRSAVCDSNGALVGVVHVLRDISNEEQVERLRDEFLSMVSHELRTPLGHIKGYATSLLLPDGPSDDPTRVHCLRIIVEASDELEELIDHLLDMSRIGAGAFGVEPRPVRLRPLVRAAVERVRLRSDGHRLRVRVPAGLPLVSADAHRIEQVFYNLLDNALKYSPGGGAVTVDGVAVGNEVIVSLSDEGIGISPVELGSLFEPFRRGEGARALRVGGRGLGLAVCKGIVEAHHGRIWAESPVPGRPESARPGTLISFTLPIDARPRRRSKPARFRAAEPPETSLEVHSR